MIYHIIAEIVSWRWIWGLGMIKNGIKTARFIRLRRKSERPRVPAAFAVSVAELQQLKHFLVFTAKTPSQGGASHMQTSRMTGVRTTVRGPIFFSPQAEARVWLFV